MAARRDCTRPAKAKARIFTPVDTLADDPAMMIYTSGTTGRRRARCSAHRVLLGHLPGVECARILCPQQATESGRRQTGPGPAGLLNVLLPGLHFGVPVVARASSVSIRKKPTP
jgi:acetyl-CoA synthetase